MTFIIPADFWAKICALQSALHLFWQSSWFMSHNGSNKLDQDTGVESVI